MYLRQRFFLPVHIALKIMSFSLQGKKIVLGVSGGIAAYKAVELLRLLIREKAEVFVVMSANAGKFITPLTFEALSGNPVYHEVFGERSSASMPHIRAAENADLLVVAPATASTIGKMACGLADDALSNVFLAFRGPVLLAPAMNDGMYANLAVQENISRMKQRGVEFIDPEEGELACGTVGQGRLAEPERILQAVQTRLNEGEDLKGLKILVTAGPTEEPLDPVRYITNPSSGKMGYAVAGQARRRGATVTLISGPTHLEPPNGVESLFCKQAGEMLALVKKHFPDCNVLVMVAAVGDFQPDTVQKEKIKKQGEPLVLHLLPTTDILQEVAKTKTRQMVIGFAAESENVVQSAQEKLKKKNLDLIVANDISAPGIGFQSDSNQVTLIDKAGTIDPLPRLSKREIADVLLDRVKVAISG
jgi:phosphopantothenoylcysteine decarboxylase/phosphopantothenate--cysteine ligase